MRNVVGPHRTSQHHFETSPVPTIAVAMAEVHSLAFAALASYKLSKSAWRDSTGPEILRTIQSWGEARCTLALILTCHCFIP